MKKNVITAVIIAVVAFEVFGVSNPAKTAAQLDTEKEHTETAREAESTSGDARELADVENAQNLTGRWDITSELTATPDHIEQEKIDDEISENFDLFCDVIYAEAGNQGEFGMRLVADVVINRMKDGESFDNTLGEVLTAPYQFSCIADGHASKFQGYKKEAVREIAQRELKQVTDPNIFYFRTGHYTQYGKDLYKYKDLYFSGRK